MSKDGLGFEVSTKLRNYTGFSPLQLLIVVAMMVWWPKRRSPIFDLPNRSYEAAIKVYSQHMPGLK